MSKQLRGLVRWTKKSAKITCQSYRDVFNLSNKTDQLQPNVTWKMYLMRFWLECFLFLYFKDILFQGLKHYISLKYVLTWGMRFSECNFMTNKKNGIPPWVPPPLYSSPGTSQRLQFRRFTDSAHHPKDKTTSLDTMWTISFFLWWMLSWQVENSRTFLRKSREFTFLP